MIYKRGTFLAIGLQIYARKTLNIASIHRRDDNLMWDEKCYKLCQ